MAGPDNFVFSDPHATPATGVEDLLPIPNGKIDVQTVVLDPGQPEEHNAQIKKMLNAGYRVLSEVAVMQRIYMRFAKVVK